MLARGSSASVAVQATNDQRTRKHVISTLSKLIQKDIKNLCSVKVNSLQRSRNANMFKQFNWGDVIDEAAQHSPTLLQLLTALTGRGNRSAASDKRQDVVVGMLISILCRHRNANMALFQRVMSMILYAGHSAKQVQISILFAGMYTS